MANRLVLVFLVVSCFLACNKSESNLSEPEKEQLAFEIAEAGYHYRQGSEIRQMYMDSAIAISPNLGAIYRSKAVWFVKCGRFKKHFELLKKAVELDSTVLNYRGKNHLLTRNYKAVVKDLLAYDKTTDNPDDYSNGVHLHLHVGQAQLALGNYDEAIKSYNQVIKCESKSGFDWVDHNAYLGKGIALKALNNLEEANRHLDTCVLIYSGCAEAYYYKSLIAIEQKDNITALVNAKNAKSKAEYLQDDKYYGITISDIDELLDGF